MTLADVLVRISQENLPPKAKADMSSAVRKVAAIVGADPGLIPVDAANLRRRLEGVSHQVAGVSPGRWNNIRSLFGKAIAMVTPMLPGRSVFPLLPPWDTLANDKDLNFNRRTRLLPLLRYFSERGVGPTEVTLAHHEEYHLAILQDRLRSKPEKAWDGLVWAWNACVREVPSWPQVLIPRKEKREVYAFPWSFFPKALQEDAQGYLRRLEGTDLSEDGPPKPARPATLATRERQLRMAASALIHKGVPKEDLTSLRSMLTFERFQLILRYFLDRNCGKPSPQLRYIASFLKTVAKYWLKLDEEALQPFDKLSRRLNQSNRGRGLTPKNRARLRPFDDPHMVQRFLELPFQIREDVEKDTKSPMKRRALRAQHAAAIAILQIMPIRRRNISMTDMEQNLITRGKRLYLVFEGDETKNEEPIDLEFPSDTKDLIAWYVREYRPHLLSEPNTALFPGEGGKPKAAGTLSGQIKKVIKDYLGIDFNMHLFRHAGTKIYLDVRPGNYEVMRRVLGHRSINTTTSSYAGAESKSVGLHFASVIGERRASTDLPERLRPPQAPRSTLQKKGGKA
jgi:integrase